MRAEYMHLLSEEQRTVLAAFKRWTDAGLPAEEFVARFKERVEAAIERHRLAKEQPQ